MGISSGGAYSGIATQPPYNMATSTVDNRMFLGLSPVSQPGIAHTLNPLDINRTTISTNTTGDSSHGSWDPRSEHSRPGYAQTPSGYPHGADPRKRQHDSALAAEEKKRNAAQLRTASRAPKKQKTPTRRDSESFEESRAREAHNQVEQQYRHRLNSHFERLLATIPMSEYHGETDMMADEEGGSPGRRAAARAGIEKRISKAEVLEMGRTWIEKLTKECAELRSEVEELRAENKKLKGARLATNSMEWTSMKHEWGGLD
ncbi:Allergen Fus c 3 [Ceratocystis platani]|uniref:Allergen Fus c 3 n=1 Tax=Ceratocystis fimbriata f. sp. platani TaxID=88771 RepID=A0A0F8CNQ5_CERFI|nr:Allergen Fus c 3 [Ceratocystis platani]